VRNTAFDMVSDGREFKLWIPPRNKFVVGLDNADNYQPNKRLENMRPQYIYDALLLPESVQTRLPCLKTAMKLSWIRRSIGSNSPITPWRSSARVPRLVSIAQDRVQPKRPAAPPAKDL